MIQSNNVNKYSLLLMSAMLIIMYTASVFSLGYSIGAKRHKHDPERSIESLLDEARMRMAKKHKQLIQKGKSDGM